MSDTDPRLSDQVAARLRAALAVMGMSKSEAARQLGTSQANFSRQTWNGVPLTVDDLEDIEKRLGIPTKYLLGMTDDLPGVKRRR
ncbi:hypothetical protein [Paenarthrobacter sp. YJN-5]|uniref:hypothetical protein n=1 Tax=Paenarthrobacter sp. YJN-5 TaxID=2735316 RepID=UPI0018782045|nr:hypothetical protein [Paenarthrobacter sp. YJN-5]QOT16464.1 hypothetical protein HMI59_07510 [Paenarthrobacter sp. YJN-5]